MMSYEELFRLSIVELGALMDSLRLNPKRDEKYYTRVKGAYWNKLAGVKIKKPS